MWCPNCGSELEEGSVFCDSCGTRLDGISQEETKAAADLPGDVKEASAEEKQEELLQEELGESVQKADDAPAEDAAGGFIFCPNCGRKCSAQEAFCDECGTKLNGDMAAPAESDRTGPEKKKLSKKLIAIPAVIAVLGIGGAIMMSGGSVGKGSSQNRILYFKDSSMMMSGVKKNAEPVEITDSAVESGNDYYFSGISASYIVSDWDSGGFLTKDGKYLFYIEDYDGEKYDLYKTRVSKPEESVKIDSNVTFFRILDDNNVFYRKKDSYYLDNGKDKLKFGKDVSNYSMDKAQKNIVWTQSESGQDGYDLYYQSLDQKKEKVKLESGISEYFCDENINSIYAMKKDSVLKLDTAGNKEKIIKKAVRIENYDANQEIIYFTREGEYELSLKDHISGAGGSDRIPDKDIKVQTTELYCYINGEEKLVSDHMAGGSVIAGTKGKYCLFKETAPWEDAEIPSSEITYARDDEAIGDGIYNYLSYNDTVLKLASQADVIGEYNDIKEVSETAYNKDTGVLYVVSWNEDEDSVLYSIATSGSGMGAAQEIDTDIDTIVMTNEDGVYYLKDYEDGNGDLYFEGKMSLADVSTVIDMKSKGMFACVTDYDADDASGSAMIYKDKKFTKVADDVSFLEGSSDGTLLMMSDYDFSHFEGDLMYYNGKDTITIDDGVSGFAVRSGSYTD